MKSIKISEIVSELESAVLIGNSDFLVKDILSFDEKNTNEFVLMWCSDKNIKKAEMMQYGNLLVSEKLDKSKCVRGVNYIIVDNPRLAFSQVLNKFFTEVEPIQISKTASIDASAIIGENCRIGNFVTIEKGCVIGNCVSIDHNTVIKKYTIIKDDVKVGANCTIGGVGFGYEKDDIGDFQFMPHIGNVIVMKNAEIGNNTCIDRAVLGSTLIGRNVKIDNQVHIAHGVTIGDNSLIIANAMVAGSVKIGKNTWVAPSSSIINGCQIGDNVTVGMGAVVIKSVINKEVVIGNPAKPLTPKKE